MKPPAVGLLCLACCLLSAGTAYLLFTTLHQTPKPTVARPADDRATTERIAQLEKQIDDLRSQIAELRKLPVPVVHAPPEVRPEPKPTLDEIAPSAAEGPAKLDKPAEPEIEKTDAAANAVRDKAVQDLASTNGRDRRAAGELLGTLAKAGDETAKQALLDALKSENPDVREAALEGIGNSELAEFMPALKEMLADTDADVREQLAQTLSDMPAAEAGPVLISMLTDTEPDVLREVADALGDFKYAAAAADLLPLTRHANEEVAIEASIAMRKLGDPSAAEAWVPTLGSRLNSTDVEARRNAAEALRRIGLETTRPYLEQAVQDTDERVRREAQRGLDDLND
jgi:HEAT repeat protein